MYIDKGYLHDDSPNNPNVTKKYDLLVPLHFSFILSCLLSEELERVNSENYRTHEIKVRVRALSSRLSWVRAPGVENAIVVGGGERSEKSLACL